MPSNTDAADSQLTELPNSSMQANDANQPHTISPTNQQSNGVQHSPIEPEPNPRHPFVRLGYLSLAISTKVEALDLHKYSDYLQYIRTHPTLNKNADTGSGSGTDADADAGGQGSGEQGV
ncbi:hypothetical protein J4E85_011575 [Alternaria conjuncta]|uniref:uncharacterized protein n=1 Tax=Alternaria conjuncta TaxID=181017 RepID=UPI00221EC2F5|nr:uncharacterized protein J4E85_011575 [Alternaria conjuncta]KAI4909753.1 hypothetical protein J4E85_011575 [Alternaria conjuncta]